MISHLGLIRTFPQQKFDLFNKAFFYIRSDEFSRRKLIIRDEIKISFPINIEMSVYSQKENQE